VAEDEEIGQNTKQALKDQGDKLTAIGVDLEEMREDIATSRYAWLSGVIYYLLLIFNFFNLKYLIKVSFPLLVMFGWLNLFLVFALLCIAYVASVLFPHC
jgi:hypothetical protein